MKQVAELAGTRRDKPYYYDNNSQWNYQQTAMRPGSDTGAGAAAAFAGVAYSDEVSNRQYHHSFEGRHYTFASGQTGRDGAAGAVAPLSAGPRYPNSILDAPVPNTPSPSTGQSALSPSMVSPGGSTGDSRRNSVGSALYSPAGSSSSHGRDEVGSHRMSYRGESASFGFPSRPGLHNLPNVDAHPSMQVLPAAAAAPMQIPPHIPYPVQPASVPVPGNYGQPSAAVQGQFNPGSYPQTSPVSYTSPVYPSVGSGSASRTGPYVDPASGNVVQVASIPRSAQQPMDDGASLPSTGAWFDYLHSPMTEAEDASSGRPIPGSSAASLRNIIHPTDQPATRPLSAIPPITPTDTKPKMPRHDNGPERRPRGIFTPEQRQETSKTRTIGACIRCKCQRIRCVPSPIGPDAPCVTCLQVQSQSKKVLHDLTCSRSRLGDVVTFRTGGLGLTHRWADGEFKDITEWVDDTIYTIEMKLFYSSPMHRFDLTDVPVSLRVRRFLPQYGDSLSRKWTKRIVDSNGVERREHRFVNLPAFALADTHETVETLRDYFHNNTMHAMLYVARNSTEVVRKHYEAAVRHFYSLPEGDVERNFLEKFFVLWFCTRFTTGSAYISGHQRLGCRPVDDPDYPLGDRISVPRMVTAQCDYIVSKRFLKPLSKDVMSRLERLFHVGNPDHWFCLYSCTFILLHEASFTSQDRRRHALENWHVKERYTIGDFVTDVQFGSSIVLRHWHYYRTMTPLDDGWDIYCKIILPVSFPREKFESAKGKGKKKVHVTQEQYNLIMAFWQHMLDANEKFNTNQELRTYYEHPLFFTSQMYVKCWNGRATYNINDASTTVPH